MHFANEVSSQRDEEENAEAAAGEADEDGLHGMRIQLEDIESWKSEDGAGNHAACGSADSCDDDIFEKSRSSPVDASEANGQD